MIRTEQVSKSYNGQVIVNNLDVYVKKGEVIGLLGPNGAGKTTSFYMIAGLVRPDSGRVFLKDQDITYLPMYKRARMGLGYLPQESSVFKKLSVEQNLYMVWEKTNAVAASDYDNKATELLDLMNLSLLRHKHCYQLSGGEKRRVEIMRVLSLDPSYILLDEPFAGIDPLAIKDIQDLIFKLKQMGLGIIITDHNIRETLAITERCYILHNGKILFEGTNNEIVSNPLAKKYYLGDSFNYNE